MDPAIDNIHQFWFGDLDATGMCAQEKSQLWFRKSDDTDRLCRQRFGDRVELALGGGLTDWEASDRGVVALVLLLDQFTRNIYRNTARAFAGDSRALGLAQSTILSGQYRRLPAIHQVFLFLPLEHSEDLATQEQCVALFDGLAAATGSAQIADFGRYAQAHHEVISQFGRFPHRNALLGRSSTAAENEYLKIHGGF